MRCQYCGMVFNNRTGVCPRCSTDVIALQSKNKILYRELFKIGKYSINFLQLYCLLAINAVIGIIIANSLMFINGNKTLWSIPATLFILEGYYLLAAMSSSRRNIMKRIRRVSVCLQLAMILLQIFVLKTKWVSDFFMPSVSIVSYLSVIVAVIVTKGKVSQKYFSLIAYAIIGIVPFILVLCGYTSGSTAAYGYCLGVFILSIFVFLNVLFFSALKLKYNVGGLLE